MIKYIGYKDNYTLTNKIEEDTIYLAAAYLYCTVIIQNILPKRCIYYAKIAIYKCKIPCTVIDMRIEQPDVYTNAFSMITFIVSFKNEKDMICTCHILIYVPREKFKQTLQNLYKKV